MRESRWLQEIRTLDPERDCRRIAFLDAFCEFPFDTARSLELAFFKTFASPTIAALLDSTGEFNQRGQLGRSAVGTSWPMSDDHPRRRGACSRRLASTGPDE